jgi:hypothetical protein
MSKKTPKKNPAAQALGRLGGMANTKAQNRARKRNAKFAGRPGRVCVVCGEPVRGGHEDKRLDESCGHHGWRWSRGDDAAPSPAVVLIREAIDAINNQATQVDLRDWTKAAKKFLASVRS